MRITLHPAPGSRPHSQAGGHPGIPAPSVNETALAGHGGAGRATGALRRMPTPGMTPLAPHFSRDGRWLAFLGSSASSSAPAYTVWLASGDASGWRPPTVAACYMSRGMASGWCPAFRAAGSPGRCPPPRPLAGLLQAGQLAQPVRVAAGLGHRRCEIKQLERQVRNMINPYSTAFVRWWCHSARYLRLPA
jgi:hypothetical protein